MSVADITSRQEKDKGVPLTKSGREIGMKGRTMAGMMDPGIFDHVRAVAGPGMEVMELYSTVP